MSALPGLPSKPAMQELLAILPRMAALYVQPGEQRAATVGSLVAVLVYLEKEGVSPAFLAPLHDLAEAFVNLDEGRVPPLFKHTPKKGQPVDPVAEQVRAGYAAALDLRYRMDGDLRLAAQTVVRESRVRGLVIPEGWRVDPGSDADRLIQWRKDYRASSDRQHGKMARAVFNSLTAERTPEEAEGLDTQALLAVMYERALFHIALRSIDLPSVEKKAQRGRKG